MFIDEMNLCSSLYGASSRIGDIGETELLLFTRDKIIVKNEMDYVEQPVILVYERIET